MSPSGTEPKIQIYTTGIAETKEKASEIADSIGEAMKALLK
jgi:phosphomannomutase